MKESLLLKDIIGAIISSFIDGESISARQTIDFIQKVGFTKSSGKEGDLGTIRYVSFNYIDPNSPDKKNTIKIDIPLLSLIPIPIFQIDEVDIEANFIVDKAIETKDAHLLNKEWNSKIRYEFLSRIDSVSSDISDKQGQAVIKAKIKFKQSDLPNGLPHLLRILENRIRENGKN